MRKILILTTVLMFCLSAACFASPVKDVEPGSIVGIQNIENYTGSVPLLPPELDSIAGNHEKDVIPLQRGCCSHHRGVCGCDDGRDVCCDGSYSPTCGC